MKKYFLILLFSFYVSVSHTIEISCNFEEVYGNGDIQQGVFLLKNQKLRYEYFDKDLFTIIAKENNFYLIHRVHKNNVQRVKENTEILEMIMDLAADYPEINEFYSLNKATIKIEKNSNKFIKRISINSDEVNLSINVINCKFEQINNKFFNHFNFVEYKR